MPYKSRNIRLPSEYDRRRKLTDTDYENIRKLYAEGMSQRALGRLYQVAHGTIGAIVNPKIKEYQRNWQREHWKEYPKSKEERNRVLKNWRHYKHDLYKKGLIKLEDNNEL